MIQCQHQRQGVTMPEPLLEKLIYSKLLLEIKPKTLEIINESHLHAGHHTSPNTGQSHFRIKMHAPNMADLSRIDQQRKIYALLGEELENGLHALAIEITT